MNRVKACGMQAFTVLLQFTTLRLAPGIELSGHIAGGLLEAQVDAVITPRSVGVMVSIPSVEAL